MRVNSANNHINEDVERAVEGRAGHGGIMFPKCVNAIQKGIIL
jgi:hypothetical protein